MSSRSHCPPLTRGHRTKEAIECFSAKGTVLGGQGSIWKRRRGSMDGGEGREGKVGNPSPIYGDS